jgi:hypothetical protein
MPSSFSPNLRLELIADGEQAATWGQTTNTNLGTLLEASIAGYTTVSVTSAAQALSLLNGAADQARNAVIALTTTTGAPFSVYAPPATKTYIIHNQSAFTATIYNSTVAGNTTAAGVGVPIPAGKRLVVFSDGSDFQTIESANLTGTLAVANGGTGATDATTARANLNTMIDTGANGLVARTSANVTSARAIAVSGTGLSVTNADGVAGNPTIASNATSANTASSIVARDGSGNFTAGTITAALAGNASTATALQTARAINGVNFDGTSGITIAATTPSVLTFNNGGGGGGSGTGFNGSAAQTISYNTIGAPSTTGANASGTWAINVTGNSGSASVLQTTRSINGTGFNGGGDITTNNWGTARTLTVGATGKAVNGAGDVSWSLGEIGAPSTTGSGASGTWPINITGNAATASSASSVAYTNVTGRPAAAFRLIFNNTLSYATAGARTYTFQLLYSGSPAREMVSPDSFMIVTSVADFYTIGSTTINYTVSKAVQLLTSAAESRLLVTMSGFNSQLYPNNINMQIYVLDATAVTSVTLL